MRIDNVTGIDSGLTGSFSGSFVGQLDGIFTGTATANISGAFANTSHSLSERIAAQELFSGSLNDTFATDAELSSVSGALAFSIANISSDFADITNKPALISSSAQIAADISGSFTSVSQSLSGRITSNETSISALSSNVSTLNSATSSYLLNTTDTLTGDLTVTGKITAQEFHTEFVSASIIYDSGSTKFGNSADDRHEFTGSVNVSNGITGTLTGNASTATSASYAASGPFLSSYTETDTLASVTGRGASTTTDISIANGQPKLRLKETDSTNVDKELLVSGGDFYIRNLNDNDTAGTNLLQIDSSGNLSATGRGQFAGALRVTETGTAQHILIGNQDSSGTNAPAMIRGVNAALQFGVGNSWVGEGGTMTVRMELKNDGNAYFSNSLGIGVTAPSKALHLGKDSAASIITLQRTNTNPGTGAYGAIHWSNSSDHSVATIDVRGDGDNLGGEITFRTTGAAASNDPYGLAERMRIDSSGYVGIGTTSPQTKLHVTDAITISDVGSTNDVTLIQFTETQNYDEFAIKGDFSGAGGENRLKFTTDLGGGDILSMKGDGNVGIGETNPAAPLHIRGTSQTKYVDDFTNLLIEDTEARLQLISNTNGNQGSSIILSNIDKHWAIQNRGVSSNYNLAIGYVDTTDTTDIVGTAMNNVPLTLTTGGSVGIGTGTPKDVLDIKGGGVAEGGIAFGSKSVSISATFANVITVSLGNHTGVYVKITAFGDWSSHSTIAYVGEFFLQNGAGGYMEPGIIIREDTNIYEASQDNDNVVAQIVDPGGSTGDRDFIIQLAATRSSGTPSGLPFTAHIQYEVRGQYKSIS